MQIITNRRLINNPNSFNHGLTFSIFSTSHFNTKLLFRHRHNDVIIFQKYFLALSKCGKKCFCSYFEVKYQKKSYVVI